MNFEAKIIEVTTAIKAQVSTKKAFMSRVFEIEKIIIIGFNAFKFKEFSQTIISKQDIHQTLCKIIQDNEPSKRDLSIFNAYVKQITVYKIDIPYILEHYQLLQYAANCDSDIKIII